MAENINSDEILIAPLEDIVGKIASAVAKAQMNLDLAFLTSQKNLKDNFPDLANIGYLTPWYYMPETNVELKMVMHYEKSEKNNAGEKYKSFWSPFNPKYSSSYTFDSSGTSSIKFKLISIPPPPSLSTKSGAG